MIGRIRGTLVQRGYDTVLIDVNGLGYEISVTPRTLVELPGIGEEVVLHTHLHVREDVLALFGFDTATDKDLFAILLGVSGVGPKVSLAILATMTYEQLRVAVASDDIPSLTSVPGIGKRSAQKLLLELKPKLEVDDAVIASSGPLAEVREALVGLGYGTDEISGTLASMPPDLSVEELLRESLRELGKDRG
ncbi:MAG: Holliday junction branch migration protein RuvA [Acidimicrobiia bacterium]